MKMFTFQISFWEQINDITKKPRSDSGIVRADNMLEALKKLIEYYEEENILSIDAFYEVDGDIVSKIDIV